MATLGPTHDAVQFRGRNRLALAMVFVAILALLLRLLVVQWLGGANYEKFATIDKAYKVRAQATRGLIKGSDGTVLARNIESHSLELLPSRVGPERVGPLLQTLREFVDVTDNEIDALRTEILRDVDPRKRRPIVVRRDLVSTHCPYDSSELEHCSDVEYRFCPVCGRSFEPVPQKKACPFDQRKLGAIPQEKAWRCSSCEREFSDADACPYDHHVLRHGHHNLRCPLCQRTFNNEVAVLRANQHRMPEARIETDIQREYPYRYLASHIIGFMGYVNETEMYPLGSLFPALFSPSDRVGKSGIERAYDPLLRGLDGEQVVVRRSGNEESGQQYRDLVQGLAPKQPVPGGTLRLTLDLELQRTVKTAMKDVYSGAAVVLDARTGEVLALYSKPSFDPNVLSGKRAIHGKNPQDASAYAPLLNKAVTAFAPASTFKVVAAIAAIEENVVNPSTTFHCPGYYDFGGRRFHCHSKRGHGDVNLREAIRSSCDVYFYHLGELLGLDRLEAWARKLGFGQPTGIEIREALGRVPTRDWYNKRVKGGYYPGFALSTAVGQKDVTTTPLQLARVYTALGRDGVLPNLTLLKGLEDSDGHLLPRTSREPGPALPVKPSTLKLIRTALLSVVNDEGGTAHLAQLESGLLAGKTGTAQAAQRPRAEIVEKLAADPLALSRLTAWLQNDHAWFVGYAPADDPAITVAVFVEHGGSGGHNAAPIASRIVQAWLAHHPPAHGPVAAPTPKKKAAEPVEELDEVPSADPEDIPTVPDEPRDHSADEPPAELE